jgi:single-stranded-DNA-specific exonuclease
MAMSQVWRVKSPDPYRVQVMAKTYGLDPLLARCILNREIERFQEIDSFLEPDQYEPPSPFLMPDMHKTVTRIGQAIANNERICIYGDYDADGVTAIAILLGAIEDLGGDVFYYIPDRFFEGVGLHADRLRALHDQERVGLVITVDTGIRAFEEMEFARKIGLDVIITDHHTPDPERPDAFAVLNPKTACSKYPFDGLSGAGVAFKVVQALDEYHPGKINLRRAVKIAAVGTIADMVPLREENRWIVSRGLREIQREENGPFRALLRKVGVRGRANALDISFKLAPRINAPGRLGDPDTAIAFLRCKTAKDAVPIIDIMDGMNTIRQMLEKDLEAKLELQLQAAYRRKVPPFILVTGRHWHRGILGIMACKIVRRYKRPACVLSIDDHEAHGSMRGVPGVNLVDALNQIEPLLNSFGGHPEAAGVSMPITNIPQFKARMTEILNHEISDPQHHAKVSVDAEVAWSDMGRELFAKLLRLAPFGIGNTIPVFMSTNLILESEPVRRGPWYHFEASDGNISRRCSFYHPTELNYEFERFDSVDLVFSLTPFREDYQVQIIEMRPTEG